MKYIIKSLLKYSSINAIYVGSIVYLDLKYQKRRLFTYKEHN